MVFPNHLNKGADVPQRRAERAASRTPEPSTLRAVPEPSSALLAGLAELTA